LDFNLLDYLILAWLIWGFIAGFRRGLVMELALLAGVFLGIWMAMRGSGWLAQWLEKEQGVSGPWMTHLSFVLVFAGVYVLAWMAGKSLSLALNLMMLGLFNKLAGGVFGLGKALMLCAVLLGVFQSFQVSALSKSHEEGSQLYASLSGIVPALYPELKKRWEGLSDKTSTASNESDSVETNQ
jgi:membrane protein required for colicin V production